MPTDITDISPFTITQCKTLVMESNQEFFVPFYISTISKAGI
jgi:hypothetical protein